MLKKPEGTEINAPPPPPPPRGKVKNVCTLGTSTFNYRIPVKVFITAKRSEHRVVPLYHPL